MTECISEGLYRIPVPLPGNPLRELNSYLLRGRERSLLIDTGFRQEEGRHALFAGLAELDVGGRPLGVASIHLENRTHGEGRRLQLEAVLRAAEELLPGIPVVLGGDLNTNTFDGRDKDAIREIAGSPALQRRCLEDVAQYEAALTAAEAMGYRAVPETPILTRRKPLPGGGCLGLRLDWLLLRGMTPTKSRTLSTRTADCGFARPDSALARFAGEELSDHNAVWAACRMGVKDAK